MNAPKKILITADTTGGVWTYVVELAQALAEQNVHLAIATMGAKLNREQRKQVKLLPNAEIFESTFRLEWMDSPWDDVAQAGDWLLELEAKTSPDLVHLNNYAHGALPWRAPKIVVGHSCVLSWWQTVKRERIPSQWDRYRDAVRAGLHAADLVVTPSRAMMNQLNQLFGSFAGRVIHKSRDPSLFHPGQKEKFIFCAGRLWDEANNIAALSQVAEELAWPIYVAGEDRSSNGARASRHHLHFLGRLSTTQMAEVLGKASVYALPARYEPFGLTVLEAALSGCALVLGDIASLREVWNGAARFVAPDDRADLKFSLQQLIDDPVRMREWAAYAQCRAIQFTPQEMAQRYLAAYRDVLNPRVVKPAQAKRQNPEVACVS